jgi:hypothetical protein
MKLLILLIMFMLQLVILNLVDRGINELTEIKIRLSVLSTKECPDYNVAVHSLPDNTLEIINEGK